LGDKVSTTKLYDPKILWLLNFLIVVLVNTNTRIYYQCVVGKGKVNPLLRFISKMVGSCTNYVHVYKGKDS